MANMTKGESTQRWTLKPLPTMTDKEFFQWQGLLEKRTGMNIAPERKTFLQTNVGTRMREAGCQSYKEYFEKVTNKLGGMMEWATLVDRLTVQETRFYRDEDAFVLVSSFLSSLPRTQLENNDLELWSVGCSTGEEPYTLAMAVEEALQARGVKKKYFVITGTDISTYALAKARTARYPRRKLVTLNQDRISRYFTQVAENQFEVIPRLRERVCFSRVNVVEIRAAPLNKMTIIYCQNLLIYFKRWRRKEILNLLAERLIPGGLLVLGLGEIVDWNNPLLKRIENDKTLAFIRRK